MACTAAPYSVLTAMLQGKMPPVRRAILYAAILPESVKNPIPLLFDNAVAPVYRVRFTSACVHFGTSLISVGIHRPAADYRLLFTAVILVSIRQQAKAS